MSGFEIGVPILEYDRPYALPCVSFRKNDKERIGSDFRTFEDENLDVRMSYGIMHSVERDILLAARFAGEKAFKALGMAGMGRIDMRIDEDGRYWIFDTNESPPPLEDTSYGCSFRSLGFDHPSMLKAWVASAFHRHKKTGY